MQKPTTPTFGDPDARRYLAHSTSSSLALGQSSEVARVVRFLDVHAELALVQVRDDAAEAAVLAELERLTLDVLGDPPPLLYDDHGGRRLVAALVARDLGVAEGDLLHG